MKARKIKYSIQFKTWFRMVALRIDHSTLKDDPELIDYSKFDVLTFGLRTVL